MLNVLLVSLVVGSCTQGGGPPESAISDEGDVTYEQLVERITREQREAASKWFPEDPPEEVHVVRIVEQDEWVPAQIDCIAEAGFEVEDAGQGGGIRVVGETPSSQRDSLNRAVFECRYKYPTDPRRGDLLKGDDARTLFRHLRDTVTPCVEGLGYVVDAPPSEDLWISKYLDSANEWDPYEGASGSEEGLSRVYEECPNVPEGLFPSLPEPSN
ncbi:hypothetical protein [Ornithinimicrobium murale]|uniref:hypothetical protein n=1 Tax=Ornithinimicrobium murale TaxID=1050153 RepID=UPI0013B40FCF|nr:hypothetical protein [Ornithinimicrobium murale]